MKSIPSIDRLVGCLKRLPGIGRRSAERIAFDLTLRSDSLLKDLAAALQDAERNTVACSRCGGMTRPDQNPCSYCADAKRDGSMLCVVETAMDLLLVENSGSYAGRYHVLGGKISPMRGAGMENTRIAQLRKRIETEGFREVILALNSDVESDATASLINDLLNGMKISVTRPAMGLPAGSGIAYIDHITLTKAMQNRQLLGAAGKKSKNNE